MKQDSLERSQSDLKKLRRKSQGKNASKYESKENEVCGFVPHILYIPTHAHVFIYILFIIENNFKNKDLQGNEI